MKASWKPKKRKWLDEMTLNEQAKLSRAEKESLVRQEGQYLKKKLAAEAQARQRALEAIRGYFVVGMPTFLSFFFSLFHPFFFLF